jgi:hypothetical protein
VTAASVSNSVSDSSLPGELIDSLIEAVVLSTDASARSAVVCDLLKELCNAVEWLHGSETLLPADPTSEESASLRQLVVAAHDHQLRMRALDAHALGNGSQR